jgi:OmpA-OmpF porin, OOP family
MNTIIKILPHRGCLKNWLNNLLIIGLLISADKIFAGSSVPEDTILSYKAKAVKYDKKNDVSNAIFYYSKYLSFKQKDIKANYRLASLHLNTRNYSNANQYLDSVIKLNSKKYPLAYYQKGLACMSLSKYDDAVEAFTKFRKYYKPKSDRNNYRKLAGIYQESAVWAKSNSANDGEIIVNHPGADINHANIDFSPFPVNDNAILYGAVYSDPSQNISPVRQIFKAVKIDDKWKSLGILKDPVNDLAYNTGNAVVSEDGQRMYFTRSIRNWQNKDICEIYLSRFDGNSWQMPEKLPYPVNNENYTSTQPAIGVNAKTGNEILYFVSNRPGGKGGLDIWFTEYDKNSKTYKEPQPLDKGVNTIGDECCPFYDVSDRTLYYSSNGKKEGFGGFDIYQSTGSGKKWTEGVILPKPVNSSYDDYYYSVLKNNKEGYFTSNRPGSMAAGDGGCCDDIFTFTITKCTRVGAWGIIRNSDDQEVYKKLNNKYKLGLELPKDSITLADVPIELYLKGEKEEDDIFISNTKTDQNGMYHFDLERNKNYSILVKNYGYFDKRFPVSTMGASCADTIKTGTTRLNYLPKVNVRVNIYYDSDKYKLSDSAQSTIDTTLMPLFDLFPNAIVEIGSHTDSTGSEAYNLALSQKRSESVVNYLISKGISKERLVAKGYGLSSPIAPNTNSDGSDNPSGRQLNRRTEIKIIGEISNLYKED